MLSAGVVPRECPLATSAPASRRRGVADYSVLLRSAASWIASRAFERGGVGPDGDDLADALAPDRDGARTDLEPKLTPHRSLFAASSTPRAHSASVSFWAWAGLWGCGASQETVLLSATSRKV